MREPGGDRNRLESWKQIAAYLNKSERTVRRWQETEGLPVHKHQHQQRGSVWAYTDELQQWLAGRTVAPEMPQPPAHATRRRPSWPWLALAGLTLLALGRVLLKPSAQGYAPEHIPVTTLPGSEYAAAVSPDGRRIAFQWTQARRSENGIYVKSVDADAVTALAVASGKIAYFYSPAWSPDGRTVGFLERTSAAETWLCLISGSGGEPRRLKQIATAPAFYFGNQQHISWSPDSRWMIVPMALGSQQGIYRISADTGAAVAITTGNALYAPALSSDGRRLVSLRHEGLPITSEEVLLYELNSDYGVSSGPVVLYRGHSSSSGITWVPGSNSLVLCNSEPSMVGPISGRLFQFRAEAGAQMRTIGGDGCSTVTTAPDGSLVYGAGTAPRSTMLRAMLQPRGPAGEFLASSRYDSFPRFAPDGRKIAFYSTRSGHAEIWVAGQDSTSPRRVSEGTRAHSGAAWSPNSDRVVYVSGDSLAISDLSGGKPQKIDLAGRVAQHPVWSADGKTIYYTASSHLWRVRPDGTAREMLRELPPILELHAGPDGNYLYYSKGGNRFTLCRVPLNGGPEEVVQEDLALPAISVGRWAVYSVRDDGKLYAQTLSDRRIHDLGILLAPVHGRFGWDTRLTVSPDGSIAVWVLAARAETDIVMQKLRAD